MICLSVGHGRWVCLTWRWTAWPRSCLVPWWWSRWSWWDCSTLPAAGTSRSFASCSSSLRSCPLGANSTPVSTECDLHFLFFFLAGDVFKTIPLCPCTCAAYVSIWTWERWFSVGWSRKTPKFQGRWWGRAPYLKNSDAYLTSWRTKQVWRIGDRLTRQNI